MGRFELKEGEKLISFKRRAYWKNLKHAGNFGTLYLTDKRIVFCATAGWKLILFGQIFDSFIKSANIRWESDFTRVGFEKGTGLHSKLYFLTLDGKNSGVGVEEDFFNLMNTLKK